MPIHELKIPDVTQNIHRPETLAIIKNLIYKEVLPTPVKLRYHVVSKSAKVAKRDNAGYVTDPYPHRAKLLGEDVLLVEVTREPLEEPGFSMKAGYMENKRILDDKSIGVSMASVFELVKVNCNLIYQSSSRNVCVDIANNVRNRIYVGREVNLHDVSYSVAIPEVAMEVFKIIHAMKEKVAPYSESMDEYLRRISTPNMISVADVAGKNSAVEWEHRLLRMEGRYESADIQVSDNDDGTYTVEIPYTYYSNEPLFYKLEYPITVHNQLMPKELVIPRKDTLPVHGTISPDPFTEAGVDSTHMLYKHPDTHYPVKIPPHDPVSITHEFPSMMSLVQALALIGDDKKSIIDLDALGTQLVYDKIKEYLHKVGKENILEVYKGIFHVSFFVNGDIMHQSKLDLDADLILSSKKELDLRDVHRVVLSVVYNFHAMTEDTLERLIEDRALMRAIINVAYLDNRVSKIMYEGVMGKLVYVDNKPVELKGITTMRGLKFLYKVMEDADVSLLEYRTATYDSNKHVFDSIWTEKSIVKATSRANTLNMRTVQQAYVESKTI